MHNSFDKNNNVEFFGQNFFCPKPPYIYININIVCVVLSD